MREAVAARAAEQPRSTELDDRQRIVNARSALVQERQGGASTSLQGALS